MKFASSVGFVQLDKVRDYVKNQPVHNINSTLKRGEDVISLNVVEILSIQCVW